MSRDYICSVCGGTGHNRRQHDGPTASRRVEAGRLVCQEGLSLAEAGRRVGISRQAARQGWRCYVQRDGLMSNVTSACLNEETREADLGLENNGPCLPSRVLWTASEDSILRDRYAHFTCSEISAFLGNRTKYSVFARVQTLGLRKDRRHDYVSPWPSEVVRAYTAGLLDGEGSVMLQSDDYAILDGKCRWWTFSLSIASSVNGYLEDVKRDWNVGSIKYYKSVKDTCKPSGKWRISSFEGEWMLRALLPFLRLKREHAEVALEFRSLVSYRGPNSLSAEVVEKRTQLALRLCELNKKTGGAKARKHEAFLVSGAR